MAGIDIYRIYDKKDASIEDQGRRRLSKNWSLMATHGVVLLHIASNPDATMREMSDSLCMTERRISQVVHDLADANIIEVRRQGRRNSYFLNCEARLADPALSHIPISRLVAALSDVT